MHGSKEKRCSVRQGARAIAGMCRVPVVLSFIVCRVWGNSWVIGYEVRRGPCGFSARNAWKLVFGVD